MGSSILKDISETLESTGIQIETGLFSGKAPSEYLVIVPLIDYYELYSDDLPRVESQEVRLSLFSVENYVARKNQITKALIEASFTITSRRYLGFEEDTGFHHFAIDVTKVYDLDL